MQVDIENIKRLAADWIDTLDDMSWPEKQDFSFTDASMTELRVNQLMLVADIAESLRTIAHSMSHENQEGYAEQGMSFAERLIALEKDVYRLYPDPFLLSHEEIAKKIVERWLT